MIALERIRTAQAIKAKYRGADKKEKDKELLFAKREFLKNNTALKFNSDYWKLSKTQLKKETSGKCAYCEANTSIVAHGDVEHYRPKSKYWWLAYTYDNYLYCCQICNQTYKSNNFPVLGNSYPEPIIEADTPDLIINSLAGNISPDPIDIEIGFPLHEYLTRHYEEKPLLINPYLDDPSVYFAYEVDELIMEVKIVPKEPIYSEHVKAAEVYYGVNRIELKNARFEIFSIFSGYKKIYHSMGESDLKNEVKKQLDKMLSRNYPFSGMNRFFDEKR